MLIRLLYPHLTSNLLHYRNHPGNRQRNYTITSHMTYRLRNDLDLAVKTDRKKVSGAPSKTSTKVFMAIGDLHGEDHNLMHDLESFFWVLLWIGVHWNGPGRSRSMTNYDSWNYKATGELAEIKKGKVDEEDKFTEEIEKEFTAQCKPLIPCIQELREVVFPGGKRWLREDRQLYSRMRSVLQRIAEELDSTEQQ
jgi:hypothetical protein